MSNKSSKICTLCHQNIDGQSQLSTNKWWIYHRECYKKVKDSDRPLSWYLEHYNATGRWKYLFD